MKKRYTWQFTAMLAACAWLASCSGGEGELPFTPERPDKSIPASSMIVRTAVYVDTAVPGEANAVLSTAGNYIIDDSRELPYFDYIILSGGLLKNGPYSAYVSLTDELTAVLEREKGHIKSLRNEGIKVLLGVTGGGDGVSFGSLQPAPVDGSSLEMMTVARQIVNICGFYGLSGAELWDAGGDKPGTPSPYPQPGFPFWDGQTVIDIPPLAVNPGDPDGSEMTENCWKEGAARTTDLISFIIETFGASGTVQGEIDGKIKYNAPLLIREAGFSKYLPEAVHRYTFSAFSQFITYYVNADGTPVGSSWGGMNPDADDPPVLIESGSPHASGANDWEYAPTQINLKEWAAAGVPAADDNAGFWALSKKLGRGDYDESQGDPMPDPDTGGLVTNGKKGASQYGLVYYSGMQLYSAEQLRLLSIISEEVFGCGVRYAER